MCLDERTYVVKIGQEEPDESRSAGPTVGGGEEDGRGRIVLLSPSLS